MARGQVTISTHGGYAVAVGHNLRVAEIVKHEPHIDPDGVHETWHHQNLREFYQDTFEAAREDYDRTARKSRRIGKPYLDYLTEEAARLDQENEQIRAANAEAKAWNELHEADIKAGTEQARKFQKEKPVKRPVYEEIIGVYPQDGLDLEDEEMRELLRLHVLGDGTPEHPSWQERHPGLKVVGIYYHADEPDGGGPHVHLDYVPVAESSRGMAVQNSLEKALSKEGLTSGKVVGIDGLEHLQTAREQWSAAENQHLQEICEQADLEVIHPQRGKNSVHVSTAEKKLIAQLEAEDERQQRRQESLDRQQEGLDMRAAAMGRERDELNERQDAWEQEERRRREKLEREEAASEARIREKEAQADQDAAEATRTLQEAKETLNKAAKLLHDAEQLNLDAKQAEQLRQLRKTGAEVNRALQQSGSVKQADQDGQQLGG